MPRESVTVISQIVAYVFLRSIYVLDYLYKWASHVYWWRSSHTWVSHEHSQGQECETIPDLRLASRVERLRFMSSQNTRFYREDLATFIPGKVSEKIRLIHIQPGKFSEPLECTTRTTVLSRTTNFVALSYAWGDWDSSDSSVTLNGQGGFRVTRNAYNALRRIRALGENDPVWIDAICIDQFNTAEKEQQISLMGAIYKFARVTYVYLGPCQSLQGEETQDAIDDKEQCDLHELEFESQTRDPWLREPSSPDLRWWRRVWTVQEAVLPRDVEVLLGPHRFHWTKLRHLAGLQWPLPPAVAASVREVDSLRHQWLQGRDHSGLPLSVLLSKTASREATQGPDRVFSVLGMKTTAGRGTELDIVASYGKSPAEVDLRVMRYIITYEQSLDIFTVGTWPHYESPTWVLKFTEPTPRTETPIEACKAIMGGKPPSAAARARCTPSCPDDDHMSFGEGVAFDQIQLVVDVPPQRFERREEREAKLAELAGELYAKAHDWVVQNCRAVMASPLSKTFAKREETADWNSGLRMRCARSEKTLHKLGSRVWGSVRDTPGDFYGYARHCAAGRAFYVTKLGFVGVAFPSEGATVRPGQHVVVVSGTKMPFVLSVEAGPENDHRYWKFVCAAYLSCVMNNEIFTHHIYSDDLREEIKVEKIYVE